MPDRLVLARRYKQTFGRPLNLRNPKTFNEKLYWLMLYYRPPLVTTVADKYAVRSYVAERVRPAILNELYGVWDRVSAIDFDTLPDAFVLKVNWGWRIAARPIHRRGARNPNLLRRRREEFTALCSPLPRPRACAVVPNASADATRGGASRAGGTMSPRDFAEARTSGAASARGGAPRSAVQSARRLTGAAGLLGCAVDGALHLPRPNGGTDDRRGWSEQAGEACSRQQGERGEGHAARDRTPLNVHDD